MAASQSESRVVSWRFKRVPTECQTWTAQVPNEQELRVAVDTVLYSVPVHVCVCVCVDPPVEVKEQINNGPACVHCLSRVQGSYGVWVCGRVVVARAGMSTDPFARQAIHTPAFQQLPLT